MRVCQNLAWLVAALAAVFALSLAPARAAPDQAGYDRLLQQYVVAGADGVNRVQYAAWKANAPDRAALDAYIASLEATSISKLSRDAQFAAWVNLYNALTLKVVIDHYPVRTIRDIKSTGVFGPKALLGPWATKRVTVEGVHYSLDDIEHGVLRAKFRDARVHYALNCASYGCPNLQRRAWRAESLPADLDAAARDYVNHSRGVALEANGLRISSIYRWFQADFGGSQAAVLAHLSQFAQGPTADALAKQPKILGDSYDWSLNALGGGQ